MSLQPQKRRPVHAVSRKASDVELLLAVAVGDEPAFGELRERYARAVRRVCTDVGAERDDCEQEVFARVWRKASLFNPQRGSPAAWLLTVARRTALNVQTARRAPFTVEERDVVDEQPPRLESFWLQAALERLPQRERDVIELAYYRDLTEQAIAQRLRVPLGSVKSWKRRGLNRLATLLGDEAP